MKIKLASLAKFWLLQNRTFELFCRIGTRETGIKEKQKKVSPSWQSCFKSNTTTLDHKVERRRAITAFTKFLALLLKLWRRFLIFYRSKASIGPLLKDHYHPADYYYYNINANYLYALKNTILWCRSNSILFRSDVLEFHIWKLKIAGNCVTDCWSKYLYCKNQFRPKIVPSFA